MHKVFFLAVLAAVVVAFMALGGGQAAAKAPLLVDDDGVVGPAGCHDVGISVSSTIQGAVDEASAGDRIHVCPGVYNESVVISTDDITLKAEPGAILDGTGAGVDGIRLTDGVSGVTIKYFEIRNYTSDTCCGQGNAIQAWNDGTSDISIIGNSMHDNSWNAILVGNAGTGLHTGWVVKDNIIEDNGAYSLELTNCSDCEAKGNIVSGGYAGILIQARNTVPGSGDFDPANVRVKGNEVLGATIGIYVIALVSEPTDPFDPISDAFTELRTVVLADNEVHDNALFGIYVWGYFGVAAGIDVTDNEVWDNGDYHGIVLNNVEWSSALQNDVSGSGMDGIALYGGASNNQVNENEVEDSERYGISVRSGSSDNTIHENGVSGSGTYDLHWDGSGTGNTWEDNSYTTSNLP